MFLVHLMRIVAILLDSTMGTTSRVQKENRFSAIRKGTRSMRLKFPKASSFNIFR